MIAYLAPVLCDIWKTELAAEVDQVEDVLQRCPAVTN